MSSSEKRSVERAARNLGRTQKLVLQLLAERAKLVRTIAFDWPGLTESQVRGALTRLEERGLVGRPSFVPHERAYLYALTETGREVEALVTGLDPDEDGESESHPCPRCGALLKLGADLVLRCECGYRATEQAFLDGVSEDESR